MDLSSRWAEPLKEAEGEVDQWMAYWCRVSRKQVGKTSSPCAPAIPRTATSIARRPAPAPPPPLHAPASPHSSTSTARAGQPPLLHLHRAPEAPAPPPPLHAPASPHSSTSTARAGQPPLLHLHRAPEAPAPPPPLCAPASPLLHRIRKASQRSSGPRKGGNTSLIRSRSPGSSIQWSGSLKPGTR
jgi:hypothetical protein